MSGLYKCTNCNRYYALPVEFDLRLDSVCETEPYYSAIVKCQCGAKRIAGGEVDYSYSENGEKGIMMFGHDFNEEKHIGFDTFDALMLTSCPEDDPDRVASTFSRSVKRTIHLKPGEPTYIGRHLPCNRDNHDPFGLGWMVSGQYYDGDSCIHQGGSGVLEWCTSYHDANYIKDLMQSFAKHPDTKLYVDVERNPKGQLCGSGDAVVVFDVDQLHYAIGIIVATFVEAVDNKKYFVLREIISYTRDGHSKYNYQHETPLRVFGYESIVTTFGSLKSIYPKDNWFRTKRMLALEENGVTTTIDDMMAELPFSIPKRTFRDNPFELFIKQYGHRHGRKPNYKLFKRWLRQNWSKLLLTKSEMKKIAEQCQKWMDQANNYKKEETENANCAVVE